ncbi:NAD-dependent epimerase/dehydratase family protein [Streptomyces sp. SID335]|nr:NAD-dependent epimerase/dehydratase family protein [Streptomyces sp. SID335]MYZ18462.1 NAD-dependent epimerase/dehydratase family protein [Streptomyces sp. SID337]NDZ90958.1 NAD-dependent epimerase/dehydratase family protein [Streptomyces sp. SID10115]NEB46632.1 NAD-dependent epimerase/dehydratase family protein [Streptomyces sp. SID339]
MRGMRVLVTGGAGFIGSHVVEALAARGHEPVVFDVREDAGADVRDPDAVRTALSGVDAVCHQAAMVGLGNGFADAAEYVSRNDLGTAVLLGAMAETGVRRLVLAGSMVVYGEGRYACARHGVVRPGPRAVADLAAGRFEPVCPAPGCGDALTSGLVAEDAPADPRNVYATTKLAQEHLAAAWARATDGTAVSLRYHNVYGPRMPRDTPYAGVASFFRSALARGEAPRVFEDGAQRRDFVHVRDVAAANVAALEAGWGGGVLRVYNTGSGEPHTVGEMARALSAAYGGPDPVVTGEFRLGDVRHITADSSRLHADLGCKPEVGFREGMAEFAAAGLREE